ncbi:hypothetical protein HAX54_005924 [Datura stramonium]|uniref:Uncharacterized protein n=1 Tax=Datura stramonium TaxID=4076 RepID=A0ABS8TAF8_DATST|nr:hypothetical protein [Datura stramonium]
MESVSPMRSPPDSSSHAASTIACCHHRIDLLRRFSFSRRQGHVQDPLTEIFMDSAADRQLYLTLQEIVQQQGQVPDVSPCEGSSARVIKRPFFSFGHPRSSRNAVLPVHWEP